MNKLKTVEEYNDFVASNPINLIKIGAEWCGPCRVLQNTLVEVALTNPNIRLREIDVDDCDEELVNTLGVRNIPVMIINNNGNTERVVGVRTKEQILKMFEDEENKTE